MVTLKNIMKEINKMKIKDEIELLNLISTDLYKKFNEKSDEKGYLQRIGETALNKIWDNVEDDIYNELL